MQGGAADGPGTGVPGLVVNAIAANQRSDLTLPPRRSMSE